MLLVSYVPWVVSPPKSDYILGDPLQLLHILVGKFFFSEENILNNWRSSRLIICLKKTPGSIVSLSAQTPLFLCALEISNWVGYDVDAGGRGEGLGAELAFRLHIVRKPVLYRMYTTLLHTGKNTTPYCTYHDMIGKGLSYLNYIFLARSCKIRAHVYLPRYITTFLHSSDVEFMCGCVAPWVCGCVAQGCNA